MINSFLVRGKYGLLYVIMLAFTYQPISAQQVSCKTPGSIVQDNSGDVSWNTTGNSASSDNSHDTASLNATQTTNKLKATQFGFNLHSSSRIDSINVKIEASKSGGNIRENSVEMIKNGTIQGNDKGGDVFPDSDDTLCNCGDKWGLGWSVSDINSSDMGVAISAINGTGGGPGKYALIDQIEICVHHRVFMPITLGEFTSSAKESQIILRWHTESESNNDYFVVQKTTDGQQFTTLQKVDGAGNSQKPRDYQVIDRNPTPGVNYYRLKQVDYDGTVHYHKTIQQEYVPQSTSLKLISNPVSDNTLRFQTPELSSSQHHYQIINLRGQTVDKGSLSSTYHHQVQLPNHISPGTYLLSVQTPYQQYWEKVVIQSSR